MRRIYDKKRFARKRWGKQNYWGGSARRDNRGMGTVEVILIIVVLVGLVIIFRGQITSIVNSLFGQITSQTSSF